MYRDGRVFAGVKGRKGERNERRGVKARQKIKSRDISIFLSSLFTFLSLTYKVSATRVIMTYLLPHFTFPTLPEVPVHRSISKKGELLANLCTTNPC